MQSCVFLPCDATQSVDMPQYIGNLVQREHP